MSNAIQIESQVVKYLTNLYVDDALRPNGHLQYHSHRCVQLHGTEQHHIEVLQQGMRIELVQKVHYRIRVQRCRAYDYMLLALSTMRRVAAAQFLALHPSESQLLKLHMKAKGIRCTYL